MKKIDWDISSVRVATESDLSMIVNLLAGADLPTEDIGDHIQLYIWEEAGEINAIGGWETFGQLALLRSVMTAPNQRGKGLGSQWVSRLMDTAKEKDLTDFYLLTTTAAPFFEKMGFRAVDRSIVPASIQQSTEFSSLCPSTAVVMHQSLSE